MRTDVIAEGGYLFLGSRLKRLAERMQEEVSQVSQRAGVAIQPGQVPLLAILLEEGPQTVGELARAMGLSQPVTTRNISKLIDQDLVRMDRSDADRRSKVVSLTAAGERAIDRSRRIVWPQVEAAVRQIADGLSRPLLDQIAEIERGLVERPLAERAALIAVSELVPAGDADVPGIVALMNRAYRGSETSADWHTENGYVKGDRTTELLLRAEMAAKPEATLLVWRDQHEGTLKGCVWVEPMGGHTWYLGSFAVDPQRQNGGLGNALLFSAEQWVRQRGGTRVRLTVVNVREVLIGWYSRRGYIRTGETKPFPYDDGRFGTPQRDDLSFVVLEKDLTLPEATR